jgi:hypothetical protein
MNFDSFSGDVTPIAAAVARVRQLLKPAEAIMTDEQKRLKAVHGTPEQFAVAVNAAADDLMITTAEAQTGIEQYRREWTEAGRVHPPLPPGPAVPPPRKCHTCGHYPKDHRGITPRRVGVCEVEGCNCQGFNSGQFA